MNRLLYRRIAQECRELAGRAEGLAHEVFVDLFAQGVMETASAARELPVNRWASRLELLPPLPEESAAYMPQVRQLLAEIPQQDWTSYPELAGWLYQYFLEGRKDELFSGFKRGRKARAADIPAVTQLFTPRWIARYMAENTVGRLWLELHPESPLQEKWRYYDREAGRGDPAGVNDGDITPALADWRVLDPACGCGHLLTAVFDVLLEMYREAGVPGGDAVRYILQHNLHGLDLDPVALRICAFTLLLHAAAIDSSVAAEGLPAGIAVCTEAADDEFGSLRRPASGGGSRGERLLAQRYDAVITNPPYLGRRHMSGALAGFLDREYPRTRNDLFAAFLERGLELVRPGGYHAAINQQAWMFLTGYEELRTRLLEQTTLVSLLHLGPRCFDDIGGEVVQSVCFILRGSPPGEEAEGVYWRLDQEAVPAAKEACYLKRDSSRMSRVRQAEFIALPGKRLAYELPAPWRRLFHEAPPLSRFYAVKKGMDTGCNEQYVRFWHEVPPGTAAINAFAVRPEAARWFPYAKGGGPRRWYGNHYYVVLWQNDGEAIRGNPRSNLRNTAYYRRPGITWSTVSTGTPGFRLLEPGFLFDNGGSCLFPLDGQRTNHYALLAYLNSAVAAELLRQMNPTLNVQPGDVARLPVDEALLDDPGLAALGGACVKLAREEWEESERSWCCRGHPVALADQDQEPDSPPVSLEERFAQFRGRRRQRAAQLAALEQEINRRVYSRFKLEPLGQTGEPQAPTEPRLRDDLAAYLSFTAESALGYVPPGSEASTASPHRAIITEAELLRLCGAQLGNRAVQPDLAAADLHWIGHTLGSRRGESPKETVDRFWRDEWYAEHKRRFGGRPLFARFQSGPNQALTAYSPIRSLSEASVEVLLQLAAEQLAQPGITGQPAAEQELKHLLHRLQSWHPLPQTDAWECDRTRLTRFASLFTIDS